MPARLLEVIWIHDTFIRPPGPKMVVCVVPEEGIFFRINTEAKWPVSVPIQCTLNPFLSHDSFLECGNPLELDDYVVEQSQERQSARMDLHRAALPMMIDAVTRSHRISDRDRNLILTALRAA